MTLAATSAPPRPTDAALPPGTPPPTAAATAKAVAPVPPVQKAAAPGGRDPWPQVTPPFRFVPSRAGDAALGPLAPPREGYAEAARAALRPAAAAAAAAAG
jgi:hypothetical protein